MLTAKSGENIQIGQNMRIPMLTGKSGEIIHIENSGKTGRTPGCYIVKIQDILSKISTAMKPQSAS